jgi:hypothetical protein
VDYSEPRDRKIHTFEVKPHIGFDNWVFLEESTMYSHELMGYSKMERLPLWECHPSCDAHKSKHIAKGKTCEGQLVGNNDRLQ